MLRPVADLRVAREDLLVARDHRHEQVPHERDARDPRPLRLAVADDDDRHDRQRDGGEQLVGDAEQREQRVDATQRVGDAHEQDRTPCGDDDERRDPRTDAPGRVTEAVQPGHVAERLRQHETCDARAGVDRRQDEQRLEHDREVVPELLHRIAWDDAAEHVRHAERERRGATGARHDRSLADVLRGLGDLGRGDRITAQAYRVHPRRGLLGRPTRHAGGGVDDEVQVLVDDGRRDERHDGDERLDEHRAVPDESRLALLLDELRRRARRDERVEAGQRAARDRDEQEREQRTREDGTVAVLAERRDRGDVDRRTRDDDAEREQDDRADLHERRQIVTRREQQPDRQDGRGEPVDDEAPGERRRRQREHVLAPGRLGDPAAGDDREQQEHDADERHLGDRPRTQEAQVAAHEQGDRDRHRDREHTPRRLGERVDDDEAEHRDEDDHDRHDGEHRRPTTDGAERVARHLADAAAATARRDGEHHVVLHGAREDDAEDDPHRARQVTHLRGEHGADEGAGAGDGGEVVAEQDATVRRHVVLAVLELLRRRRDVVARLHDLVRDETAVEHVADDVAADGREHEPDGVDVLTADEGDHRPADGGDDRRDGDHDLLPPGDGARGFDRDGGQPRIAVEGVET